MFFVPVTRDTRQLSRLFDDTFERLFSTTAGEGNTARNPALDVAESPSAYTVKLEVPGVAKEDVKITIEGRQVSVSATTQREDLRKEAARVLCRERSTSSFARSFTLPQEVDQESSQARLENGVLTLNLARKRLAVGKQLTVS